MSMHITTKKKKINCKIDNLKYIKLTKVLYLESKVGRHIGVQLSAVLKDSVELIRFKIK